MANKTDSRARRLERWRDHLQRGWVEFDRRWVCRADDPALLRAAKHLELDLSKDSDLLLHILADVVFGKAGRPINSKKWDSSRLWQLAVDREAAKWGLPKLSDKKAVTEIKKRHPERYRDTSEEMMRQMLKSARREHWEQWLEKHSGDWDPPEDWEPPEPDYDDDPVE